MVRSQSLLDVVDSLIDKGVALDAEVVLGLADVDLLYLRVGALLAAADRVFPSKPGRRSTRAAMKATRVGEVDRFRQSHSSQEPVPVTNTLAGSSRTLRETESPAVDDTSRSVIRLVLTLVEFIRQLLERQAVRRVRERTLTPQEIERLGAALMRLESTVHELAERHGLDPSELNLDLGPLGTLR